MDNYKQKIENNISMSEESKNKISKFIIDIDKLYMEKYNDIDITTYFNIIKDKPNKTPYAYVINICYNGDITSLLSVYFSLKYNNPKYDIICFINNINIYERNNLDNKYLKFEKISDNNINIIKGLFDVVIGTNANLVKYGEIYGIMNYGIYNLYDDFVNE